jgi:glycosyltransferase involved in cell wall biosynthesis
MINERKPRIAILHYAAPPTIGGVESTMAMHARLFANHGYPVKIIAGRGEPFDSRVPMHIIPTLDSRHAFVDFVNRKLNLGLVPSDFYPLTKSIGQALENALADVDICIVHNATTLHKNLALTAALHQLTQEEGLPLIAWCHDFAWQDPVYANDTHDGFPWNLLREEWSSVRYVVVSDSRRDELATMLKTSGSEIAVVPPGVDALDFFGVTEITRQWARDFRLLESTPILLLPARVTRRKNIELGISIIAALCAQGLSPQLLVMGPLGPHNPANPTYLDELRQLQSKYQLEHRVIFLQDYGEVNDGTRRDLYLLSDVLLFPSTREGFGIPILEAGLAHLPIFCSDIPPFRESVGEWGRYFALDESPTLISERIANFLSWDSRYQMKQRVLKEHRWERIFTERIEPLVSSASPKTLKAKPYEPSHAAADSAPPYRRQP